MNPSHPLNDADVVVIQKQTALERYTKENMGVGFLDYLNQDNQSKEQLNAAHHAHVESRTKLLQSLKKLKMSFILLNLDELKESNVSFFNENFPQSGLKPKQNLVISLGGDGTLLHASHHVGGNVKLLGVNSCPFSSVGHLCVAGPDHIDSILHEICVEKKERQQIVKRLRVTLPNCKQVPLALNDALLCHLHPAATSRYQLTVRNAQKQPIQSEKQLSSGLWVSTAAGSTAAIASYGFMPQPLGSSQILAANREPYSLKDEKGQLKKFSIDGNVQSLSIFSRMRQGLVCIDGPDFTFSFGFGDTIDVDSPIESSLILIQ